MIPRMRQPAAKASLAALALATLAVIACSGDTTGALPVDPDLAIVSGDDGRSLFRGLAGC